MKFFKNNSQNGDKTGWISTALVTGAVFLIVLVAAFTLWFAVSVIPEKATPVTVMALLGVGFFFRRVIIYAASIPRRVEIARVIYRETANINEIHLMHSSVSDKSFRGLSACVVQARYFVWRMFQTMQTKQ